MPICWILSFALGGLFGSGAAAQTPDPMATPRERMDTHVQTCIHLPEPADTVASAPTLRRELLAMAEADQADRAFTEALGAGPPLDSLTQQMAYRDSLRTDRLREVVTEHGWPTAALVGRDGANAAFLLLQHAPDGVLQALLLPDLIAAYERG
ncbi:MAG: hypothetical protein HKN04_14880 [Rhodothermaceae bacterium]|nr:hypothetical protein [Rhodothermaceae bacterium]